MKTPPFCHLHCHSDHSFLDGVGRSLEYAELAARMGQTALALTDHGNLYGLPEHRRACGAFGLKPIYGCECYVNDERHDPAAAKAKKDADPSEVRDPTYTDNHLVLLAQTRRGFENLLAINHDAVRNGYHYKPRTDHAFVCEHAEGLIATTACLGSAFARHALRGDTRALRGLLGRFKDAFGDRFYGELHVNEIEDQKRVNAVIAQECRRAGVPLILACDVHYACAEDAARQDEMIAVSRRQTVHDPKAFKLDARNLWFAGPRDLAAAARAWGFSFARGEFARAVAATQEIADRCDADIYTDGVLRPPPYLDEQNRRPADPFEALKAWAVEGFRRLRPRMAAAPAGDYKARLAHELRVIRQCGMADFYLVTADIVRECRRRGIFVWTRGSGCASLVAACMGITPLDPLRFGLLFERFVDPSRPNAPDFDLDIDATRRAEITAWLERKYGGPAGERIARVGSLQTFGLKAALRDVLAARGVDRRLGAALAAAADALPPAHGFPVPQAEIDLGVVPVAGRAALVDRTAGELIGALPERDRPLAEQHREDLAAALTMVGRVRGKGLHAAGYVVAPDALRNHLPIDRAVGSTAAAPVYMTAWGEGQASQDIAPTGLMKIDLLGLDTCTTVARCAAMAARRHGRDVLAELDGWAMDYQDAGVLREYASGVGWGLHQLGETNQALAKFVGKLRPTAVDEVVAAVALYRPGSLEFLDDFYQRARGAAEVPPGPHPVYDEITRDTYGIIVYQEQIMQILHRLGGVPLREAYAVIKAISKKDPGKIAKAREAFVEGAGRGGVGADAAAAVFDNIEKFAGYGFNRAHAASYGVLSWATAYLRSRYPLEFWWAKLDGTDNTPGKKRYGKQGERKVELIMRQAAAAGITLAPPTVGRSSSRWRISRAGELVAPLSLVIGVGDACADEIHRAAKAGEFDGLWGFLGWCERNKRVVNGRALQALALAGAFPWVPHERAVDIAAHFCDRRATKRDGTQAEQTRRAVGGSPGEVLTTRPDAETRMAFERRALGFAFWHSPWRMHGRQSKIESYRAAGRVAGPNQRRVRGKRHAFLVGAVRDHQDRNGRAMGFLTLHTPEGETVRGVCFASIWRKARPRQDRVYLVAGEYDREGGFVVGEAKRPFIDLDEAGGA